MEVRKETIALYHQRINAWIKNWFADKEGPAVIGISGGKDSTVCAALLAEALGPERVVGVLMPNGEQADISDSREVVKLLGIKSYEVNIGPAYTALFDAINVGKDLKDCKLFTTNTPARLRMTTLYGVAAAFGGYVCNTCNESEDWVGFSTKYGDAAGDFSLLNRLTKTEVVALGDFMGLPEKLVHKTPSDGMCGKSDEDALGFTYEQLDDFISGNADKVPMEVQQKIEKMHSNPNTLYKCVDMPAALSDIVTDAFGR